ncbi:hypothetical protein B7494_g4598 [Chlorociboria aeruginascens]|nr:hypothetical protein B7494_g4598 [Chlorociboria aeruginascens]
MVPPRGVRDPSIDFTPEYHQFIAKLTEYHAKRGTNFEPQPKVGTKHIDLFYLYNAVVERGGYDKVSDEKLAWRKLGQDFNLGSQHLPAHAFMLKTVYYKNLAAYEISTVYGKEPPPKEILEDTTAKGGGLLTRTLENYTLPIRREAGALGNENSEASGDDGTPARDRNESEETPGSGGRVTRGLRQAPPQRVLFQPDTQPSRQNRNTSAASHPPQPPPPQQHHHQNQLQPQTRGPSTSYNPSSGTENQSIAVANYEPRLQMPLTLRPVITPGNNPIEYARRQRAMKEAIAAANVSTKQARPALPRGMILPGTGFDGPNIYVRCLCALKSGVRAEQDYALHHLVKISMERGDKYRFESFPGLAEALIEKLLEVSSLFFHVNWQISYSDDGEMRFADINGLNGTPNILEKIQKLTTRDINDNIQTADFSDALIQINEAALTLRNMVMLEENAHYVSELYPLRDFLSIALNLPSRDSVIELKHYALDIAEQLTKYLAFNAADPLYLSLLQQLNSQDRGAILTSLRAISRISMNLEENNLLKGVPLAAIQSIIDWTLLNDEDLAHACLDFLYQYTAVVDNVDFLVTELQVAPLINQLTRLLMHGVEVIEHAQFTGHEGRKSSPTEIAPIPQELLVQLMKMEEPERSTKWLRCLFEEDQHESITQIALWQAYQAQFQAVPAEQMRPMLPAADFIKNVSTTFADKAAAQVQSGPVQKFIIKGIRFRSVPVDLEGEECSKCRWSTHSGSIIQCGQFFISPEEMYKHILVAHLGASQTQDGRFENTSSAEYSCLWDRCHRFRSEPATKLSQIASHIKLHLPPSPSARKPSHPGYYLAGSRWVKKPKYSYMVPAPKQFFSYQVTATDDRGDAAGIPLSAVLVLRNLARNLSKTEAEETSMKVDGSISLVEQLFKPVGPHLFEVYAHNRALTKYMGDLLSAIRDS